MSSQHNSFTLRHTQGELMGLYQKDESQRLLYRCDRVSTMVGGQRGLSRTNQPFLLEQLNNLLCLESADFQPPLQERRR